MRKIKKDLLKKGLFADNAASWLVQAQGFHNTGLELVKTIGLSNQPRMYSGQEMFFSTYAYKVAIYLLSHSIELLLKTIISIHNNTISPTNPIDPPHKYSHQVIKMVEALERVSAITLNEEERETFRLIEVYLKWFGRYYSPNEKDIDKIIAESFTLPDEDGMVSFKYEPKFPETHTKIDALYRAYEPKHHGLDLIYLMY